MKAKSEYTLQQEVIAQLMWAIVWATLTGITFGFAIGYTWNFWIGA